MVMSVVYRCLNRIAMDTCQYGSLDFRIDYSKIAVYFGTYYTQLSFYMTCYIPNTDLSAHFNL